jgi:hypothetical protein
MVPQLAAHSTAVVDAGVVSLEQAAGAYQAEHSCRQFACKHEVRMVA